MRKRLPNIFAAGEGPSATVYNPSGAKIIKTSGALAAGMFTSLAALVSITTV